MDENGVHNGCACCEAVLHLKASRWAPGDQYSTEQQTTRSGGRPRKANLLQHRRRLLSYEKSRMQSERLHKSNHQKVLTVERRHH